LTAPQKAALSLLIAVVLFGGFASLAFTGLFDLIEARFYNPTITASMTREMARNTEAIDEFFAAMEARFSQTLREPAVQRSFLLDQSAEDIFERSRIFGLLHESLGGLQWVRFIDSGGLRIHFSTYAPDIMAQEPLFRTYRNFYEPNFAYEAIAASAGETPRFILDGEGERIFFSLPFYDSFEIFRGTALFSLSVRALSDMFIREGRLNVGHDISIVTAPPGFLSGTPVVFAEEALISQVSSVWRDGAPGVARLHSPEADMSMILLSIRSPQGFFAGRLVSDEVFLFPPIMQIILLLSFFLTVYLTIFLLFNIRQDSVTIVQSRMKKLQISLIEQYYERKSDIDWSRWRRELEQRREDIHIQLKQGVKVAPGSARAKDIDAMIDKSWDELLSIIGGSKETALDEGKLQVILNRFLATIPAAAAQVSAQSSNVPPAAASFKAGAAETVKEIEAAEELEELEEIEQAETVEEIEVAEELEEIEIAEEVEELEKEEAELVETLETIEAAEELEEIESAEAVEEIESAEELEELEEVESAEAVEEIEAAEEIEELEEADLAETFGKIEIADEEEDPEDQADRSMSTEMTMARMVSEIEFGKDSDSEDSGDKEPIWDDFEVVSPFSHNLAEDGSLAPAGDAAVEETLEELSGEADSSLAEELLPLSGDSKKKSSNGIMNLPQA